MSGETNLSTLLKNMQPNINEGEFVFCTIEKLDEIDGSKIISFFKEKEGYAIIVEKEIASDLKLAFTTTFSWISLTIHSSLEAVGLTAAVSTALSKNRISCNVVAAYYHDHIFVPTKDAKMAIEILQKLSAE